MSEITIETIVRRTRPLQREAIADRFFREFPKKRYPRLFDKNRTTTTTTTTKVFTGNLTRSIRRRNFSGSF